MCEVLDFFAVTAYFCRAIAIVLVAKPTFGITFGGVMIPVSCILFGPNDVTSDRRL